MTTAAPLRVFEAEYRVYRKIWRGTVISTFLQPVLFLAAFGLILGDQVDQGGGDVALPVPYLAFLATGVLAATAMQTGAGDGSWPVMVGIKWRKEYHARIATPITTRDLILGRFGFGVVRLTFVSTVYTLIMVLFGAVDLWPGVLGIPPAVLTGLAFTAPITAYTATIDSENSLANLFRYGIVPLFLFSGVFFPISNLPNWLEPFAAVTPLFQGVELVRKLVLPELDGTNAISTLPMWFHVAYLVTLSVIGTVLAIRLLDRRLRP